MIGIYKITNLINGHSYIGQSVDIAKRWRDHKNVSPNDHEYNYPLYKAFRKYDVNNFSFEVLEECQVDELNEKEIYWINYYDTYSNGYNQTLGGNNCTHAIKITNELLDKIDLLLSTTNLIQKQIAEQCGVSEEMVQGINTGRYWHRDIAYPIRKQQIKNEPKKTIKSNQPDIPVEELLLEIYNSSFVAIGTKYGVSDNAVRGWLKKYNIPTTKKEFRTYVEENILHVVKTNKNSFYSSKPKRVVQIDIQTNKPIAIYDSVCEASRAIDKPDGNSHISAVCKGNRTTAYGYKWAYYK